MTDISTEDSIIEISKFFDNSDIFEASEEELKRILRHLNKAHAIPNEYVRHMGSIRAPTINTLLNMRLIERLDRANTEFTLANEQSTKTNMRLTWFVAILTIVSTIAAIAQVIIALR